MKKGIILTVLGLFLITAVSQAAQWEYISESDRNKFFIDIDSIYNFFLLDIEAK